MQVLLVWEFEVGLCLKLAALIYFHALSIVAAVVPTPFVTFAVIVFNLDEFNQTEFIVRHK